MEMPRSRRDQGNRSNVRVLFLNINTLSCVWVIIPACIIYLSSLKEITSGQVLKVAKMIMLGVIYRGLRVVIGRA